MKLKLPLFLLAIISMIGANAQMLVWQNGISHEFDILTVDSITFRSAEEPPSPLPVIPVVESPMAGMLRIVIQIPEDSECNGIALKGTMNGNNWSGENTYLGADGAATAVSGDIYRFSAIPTYENWYTLDIPASSALQFKVCLIYANDNNWQGQAKNVTIHPCGFTSVLNVNISADGQCSNFSSNGGVLYLQIGGWLHSDCVVPTLTTYTITARFPDCGFETPTIVGEFNGWDPTAYPMMVVDSTNHIYSSVVTADPLTEFKFAGAISGWNNQILLYVNAGEWDQFQQTFSSVATDSIINLDYSDPVYYKWSLCEQGGDPFLNNLKFTGFYFGWADSAYYGNHLDTIRDVSGQLINVKLVRGLIILCSEGLYLDDNYNYAGVEEGAIIEVYAPYYWAPKWANPALSSGMFYLSGRWYVTDSLMNRTIPTGKTNAAFISNMMLWLTYNQAGDKATAFQYLQAAGEEGCVGAKMYRMKYHTIEEGYAENGYYIDYLPDFFIRDGYLDVTYDYPTMNPAANNRMCGISSYHLTTQSLLNTGVDSNNNFYHQGCHLHYDESSDSYSWLDQHVHYDLPVVYDFNNGTGSNAPSRVKEEQYIGISNFGDVETTKKILNAIRCLPLDKNNQQLY